MKKCFTSGPRHSQVFVKRHLLYIYKKQLYCFLSPHLRCHRELHWELLAPGRMANAILIDWRIDLEMRYTVPQVTNSWKPRTYSPSLATGWQGLFSTQIIIYHSRCFALSMCGDGNNVSLCSLKAVHQNGLSMNQALLGLSPSILPGPKEGDLATHDISHEAKRMHLEKGQSSVHYKENVWEILLSMTLQCMKSGFCDTQNNLSLVQPYGNVVFVFF